MLSHSVDLLTPAASDPSRPLLRSSSSSNLIVRRARRKIGRQSVLCRCTSHLESSSYRDEDHAIDYCIQETSENFFYFLPSMEHSELVIWQCNTPSV